jgi:serine protease
MSFRFRSKIVPLLALYALLIGLIIPVSALDTVGSESDDILEKLTVDVPGDQKYAPGEILVKFNPGVSEEKIKNINTGHGTQVTYTSPYAGFKILKIPRTKTVEEMAEIYSKNPNVEYAVPNAIMNAFMIPNDPGYGPYQWNFKNGAGGINLEPAWEISSGEGVIVAVLDTGVAYENYGPYSVAPDLANAHFVQGKDFVNSDDHANDDNGHGTHVTGTIAQRTNNSIGVAGVAYNCDIMPVKVLDENGSGDIQKLIDGIYFATNNSAKVISMSLGFPSGYYPGPALDAALDYAYNNGVTIVAAAGNDNARVVSYPAAYEKCIAVGATRYDGKRAYYSNYGAALDVMAPGGDMTVDQNGDGYGDGILQNTFNTTTKDPADFDYWFFQGTSMATPHVSGVAALLISEGANGPDAVRAAIQNTATDLGTSGWDKYYGYGLVNAKAALDSIQSQPTVNSPPVAEAGGPYTGTIGTAVTFNGSASSDSDGSIVSYDWTFGDGSTGSVEVLEHIYSTNGTYTVTLTVTDDGGATDTDEATVTIGTATNDKLINVSSVEVVPISRKVGKNTFVSAKATITIMTKEETPVTVEGATVSGKWSGATSDIDSAITNNQGTVTVSSDEVKYIKGTPVTFTFTVNDVSHAIPWDGIITSREVTYPLI